MSNALFPAVTTSPVGAAAALESDRESDRERLRAMTLAHFQLIWRSLRRFGDGAEAVDDAVQQVFEVAARRLGEIQLGSERPFLLQTAIRVAAGLRRSYARSREVYDEEALALQPDPRPGPEESVDLRER